MVSLTRTTVTPLKPRNHIKDEEYSPSILRMEHVVPYKNVLVTA